MRADWRDLGEAAAEDNEPRRLEHNAALGRLIGGLAHELRNPLAAIQALADGLHLEMAAGDPRLEYATRIIDAASRMEGFVRAAVRFAQPTAAQATRCEALDLLSAAVDLANSDPVPTTEWLVKRPVHCQVDLHQIAECLAAILTNAREAARHPERTRIRVTCQQNGTATGWILFEVSDDGPGVPSASRSRIFEPFYSTKPAQLGMGLAFAQSLAAQNGGRVELASVLGQGSNFTLLLPEAR